MSTNTLGHSKQFGQYWTDQQRHLAEGITLTSVKKEMIPEIGAIKDYPFPDQRRTVGEFDYEMPSSDGFYPSGSFEYRHESGLFLISTEASVPKHEQIISKINQELSRDAEIDEALSVDRGNLWTLLRRAQSVHPFIVSGPEGEYDLNHLLSVIKHPEDTEQAVKKLHEGGEVENYDTLQKMAKKTNSPEDISDVTDLDIDLYQHRVVYVEAGFRHDGEFVTVTYNRGSIDIDADGDLSKEYAVQMIERDLLTAV